MNFRQMFLFTPIRNYLNTNLQCNIVAQMYALYTLELCQNMYTCQHTPLFSNKLETLALQGVFPNVMLKIAIY